MTRVHCSLEDAVAAISWAPVETDRVVSLNGFRELLQLNGPSSVWGQRLGDL
jgi:hypothetical protein